MARVLLDACVPHRLRREIADLKVETAHFAGLDDLPDDGLLSAMTGRYDVLVRLDHNLRYQNKIQGMAIAVVVLRVPSQSPDAYRKLVPALRAAIGDAKPGTVVVVA